jgi:hypothetical protein
MGRKWHGKEMQDKEWHGMENEGKARHGMEMKSVACHGKARWLGKARYRSRSRSLFQVFWMVIY